MDTILSSLSYGDIQYEYYNGSIVGAMVYNDEGCKIMEIKLWDDGTVDEISEYNDNAELIKCTRYREGVIDRIQENFQVIRNGGEIKPLRTTYFYRNGNIEFISEKVMDQPDETATYEKTITVTYYNEDGSFDDKYTCNYEICYPYYPDTWMTVMCCTDITHYNADDSISYIITRTHNEWGNIVTEDYADANGNITDKWVYAYDENGYLVTKTHTDADGNVTVYDADDNIITE